MTMHTSPDAGWYADPNGGSGLRYWNGGAWTDATQAAPVTGYPAAGQAFQGYPPTGPSSPGNAFPGYPDAGAPYPGGLPANRPPVNFFARNRFFAITLAVCGVYALIASFSNFAFFGLLPALYTFRSFQAKEPLAIVALVVTVATIFFSLHHIYG